MLSIYAPQWDEYDSYGIIAEKIATRAGDVNRLSYADENGTMMVPSPGGIMLGYPTLVKAYGPLAMMGRKIAVTMFESTVLPAGWCEWLNKFDEVVVPAHFLVQVFRDAGVCVPIHVVPLGVDDAYKQVQRLPRQDRPYTFLAIGDRNMRKGWDIAWHAFRSAFGDSSDHRLIIKCRDNGLTRKTDRGREELTSADDNVEILRADLTVDEMAALYARCDCFVFPTRGEGFGLPPREFAATGGVALATHWGGTADDIAKWGHAIPYEMAEAWPFEDQFRGQCGLWAEPDVSKLSEMMHVAALWEDLFAQSACIKRASIAKMYDWDAFADRVLEIYYGT